jgi:hypothetical protein
MNSYGTFYNWRFAGTTVMHINSSGNVGIGTTSPDTFLHIKKPAGGGDYIHLERDGQRTFAISGDDQSTHKDFSIKDITAGTRPFLIAGLTGNVGINTQNNNPSEKLEVVGNIKVGDSDEVRFGAGNDLRIYHNGTNSNIENFTGTLQIVQNADDEDITFRCDDGSGGTTPYLTIDGSAEQTRFFKDTRHTDGIKASFGNSDDLQILHDGSNSFIHHNGTGSLYMKADTGNIQIINYTNDADIVLQSDDGSGGVTPYLTLDGGLGHTTIDKRLRANDNVDFAVGTGNDLRLVHDGTHSYMTNYTGDFYIANHSDDKDIVFQSDNGSGGVTTYLTIDGGLGFTTLQKNLRANDDVRILVGSGQDAEFFHDGANTSIRNTTGDLQIRQAATDKDIIFKCDDGSGGETAYLTLDGGDESIKFYKDISNQANANLVMGGGQIKFSDAGRFYAGDSNDLQIYHDGSDSYIKENGTGNLKIMGTNIYMQNSVGSSYIDCISGDRVSLKFNNSTKLTTTNTGVEVTGNIAVSGSVQRQISTTHHTFTFGAAGSAAQDYWVPFIGSSEQAAPNVTHRTIAPYGGILKKAIVHSTVAYGSSAQVRFHRIDNGTTSVFVNDNSTDDVTTNVTADMSTAYSSVAFDFTTGNTFSAGDQIGVSFVRDNTGLGDVAITLVWEYELF